jgi:hypothetical protein
MDIHVAYWSPSYDIVIILALYDLDFSFLSHDDVEKHTQIILNFLKDNQEPQSTHAVAELYDWATVYLSFITERIVQVRGYAFQLLTSELAVFILSIQFLHKVWQS